MYKGIAILVRNVLTESSNTICINTRRGDIKVQHNVNYLQVLIYNQ